MFTRKDKLDVENLIQKFKQSVITKNILGFNIYILSTDRLSGSGSTYLLDYLFIGKEKYPYYFLLPWPKSLYKFSLLLLAVCGITSLIVLNFIGVIFTILVIYISSKIVSFSISIDIPLKKYKKQR